MTKWLAAAVLVVCTVAAVPAPVPAAEPAKTKTSSATSAKSSPAKAAPPKAASPKPAAKKPATKTSGTPAKPAVLLRPAPDRPAGAAKPTTPNAATKAADAAVKAAAAKAARKVAARGDSFDSGRVSISLRYQGVEGSLATMSAFVLPGEKLVIEARGGSGLYAASSRTGRLVADSKKPMWRWTAPSVPGGDHVVRIRDRGLAGGDVVMLHVFVMAPYDGGTTIGDYPLGEYVVPEKYPEQYRPPRGFVQVSAKNRDTPVSPHFTLGQFVCKDGIEDPTYVALKPSLLLKLELVLEELAERGLATGTLAVVSGFRTPAYNARIGNETTLSRHLYGDAADVFLDRNDDGQMDDLDGNGEIDRDDAVWLHDMIAQAIDGDAESGPLVGGLSAYRENEAHGPFVHIDTRGRRVRW